MYSSLWYRRVIVGLSFQKLEVSPSVRSNTSEWALRTRPASINQQQPTSNNHFHENARHHLPNRKLLSNTPTLTMSFLFGGARPQPSSAEKIAAAEAEIEMVSGMFNQ
jgi:hypothetical protein